MTARPESVRLKPARFATLFSAFLLLAACGSDPEPPPLAVTAGPGAGGVDGASLAGQAAPGTQEDLEVNVGDTVPFDYDSVVLNAEAQDTLRRQAGWLNQFPDVVATVEGHCDERGTREYNLALGDRRANAVKNYLTALGVAPDRLLTISYGEERPVNPSVDESAWAQNRRAVTRVNLVN